MSEYVQGYIERARKARALAESWTQEDADRAVEAIARAVYDNAEELARLAVDETGMGVYEDKVAKNRNKARLVLADLAGKMSVGVIARHPDEGITEVASPVGVVAAITPVTNPIVTPMSNAMFALKGRNAIVITPHHRAVRSSTRTVELINAHLEAVGVPSGIVQIIGEHSRENTRELISLADVVIATGGMGMVQAAYSSGRPALGVGAGNVQCIIDSDADIDEAIPMVVAGRAFDNGIICAAEQSLIFPAEKKDSIVGALTRSGAFVLGPAPGAPGAADYGEAKIDPSAALRAAIFTEDGMNRHLVGQSVQAVARAAGLADLGIDVPADVRIIAVFADGPGVADSLSGEKMCPVLTLYPYGTFEEAVAIARANLEFEGKGHTVSIHSRNEAHIEYAGLNLPVSRVLVNQSSATSAGGSEYNGLAATNTLGCGSWGGNSISENLTYRHLLNISRIAYRLDASRFQGSVLG
ncbi:MAG: aldehyde dehydrogenase family protein [Clostridiales Family XIII bacterium]|jgi:succinate-semialdehyde dehydrogenase|nr:aldehyde dehydrogenase family protein [Clostridiales Family XIII bacterium]